MYTFTHVLINALIDSCESSAMQISLSSADASHPKTKSLQRAAEKHEAGSRKSKGQKTSKEMRDEIDSW